MVASGERSFSKLKLIKTYFRSTMTNDRFSGLAIIVIKHQLCRELDVEEIIKDCKRQGQEIICITKFIMIIY
jgi:hypothetical protein